MKIETLLRKEDLGETLGREGGCANHEEDLPDGAGPLCFVSSGKDHLQLGSEMILRN